MKKTTAIYIFGWVAYLGFSFTLFPVLSITVMLASIPLTMLGGWLYQYKGALATTFLTIPCHYVLLSVHSDDAGIVMEAFNPFGIFSQLLFSCGTALLKRTQEKYNRLYRSLQDLVKERTQELETLTNHLINLQEEEKKGLYATLLEKPQKELEAMLEMSQLLKQHLESTANRNKAAAEALYNSIRQCLQNLRNIEQNTTKIAPIDDLEKSLLSMAEEMKDLTEASIQIIPDSRWNQVASDHAQYLHDIIFEAISNALQHAHPSIVRIGFDKAGEGNVVVIENDGRSMAEASTEGMGIPLMRYRATKIGGDLLIESAPNGNTRVGCVMPHASDSP
ncbi:MAG: hypothetical protein KJN67_04910 [Pontiella sp.]|nr:hypothetical protein [Pontiella sp.]